MPGKKYDKPSYLVKRNRDAWAPCSEPVGVEGTKNKARTFQNGP